jgi:hypothetical protein
MKIGRDHDHHDAGTLSFDSFWQYTLIVFVEQSQPSNDKALHYNMLAGGCA